MSQYYNYYSMLLLLNASLYDRGVLGLPGKFVSAPPAESGSTPISQVGGAGLAKGRLFNIGRGLLFVRHLKGLANGASHICASAEAFVHLGRGPRVFRVQTRELGRIDGHRLIRVRAEARAKVRDEGHLAIV